MKSSVVAAGLQCSITSRWLQQHQTLLKSLVPTLEATPPIIPCSRCSAHAAEMLLMAIVFCSPPTC